MTNEASSSTCTYCKRSGHSENADDEPTNDSDDDDHENVSLQPSFITQETAIRQLKSNVKGKRLHHSNTTANVSSSLIKRKNRELRNDAPWVSPIAPARILNIEHPSFVEIVGSDSSTCGRNCERHTSCGEKVAVNDIIVLRASCINGADGTMRPVIQTIAIEHGTQK